MQEKPETTNQNNVKLINNPNYSNKNNPKHRTFFIINEVILYEENETVEYKNYQLPLRVNYSDGVRGSNDHTQELVDNLRKQFCGFLNNQGGRLYIGINDDREVEGVTLNSKQRDVTRNTLVNLTSDFYPKCRTDKIKIHMIPIKQNSGHYIANKYIVKIIVKKGDSNKLYSVSSKNFKSYMRLPGQCVELTCMEIEKEIIDRNGKMNEENPWDDYNDPEPEIHVPIEEEMPNNEVLNIENNDNLNFKKRNKSTIKHKKRSKSLAPHRSKETSNIKIKNKIQINASDENNSIKNKNIENKTNSNAPNLQINLSNIDLKYSKNQPALIDIDKGEKEDKYSQKKKILERRIEKENDHRSNKDISVLVEISNLPMNINKDQIYNILRDHEIIIDSSYRTNIKVNKYQLMASAKLKVYDMNEAKRLKSQLKEWKYMNRQLNVII